MSKAKFIALVTTAVIGLAACSSDRIIDTSVDAAGGATKIVAKGVLGAVRGGTALVIHG